jgi:hypothetical protein
MLDFLPLSINGIGIGLEALGFVLMIHATRSFHFPKLLFSQYSTLQNFIDKTKPLEMPPGKPKIYELGIGLVIAGFVGQIIVMFT